MAGFATVGLADGALPVPVKNLALSGQPTRVVQGEAASIQQSATSTPWSPCSKTSLTPLCAFLRCICRGRSFPFRTSLTSTQKPPSTTLLAFCKTSKTPRCRILAPFCPVTFNRHFLSFRTAQRIRLCCPLLGSVDPVRVAVRLHVIHLSTPVLPHSSSRSRPSQLRFEALLFKPDSHRLFAASQVSFARSLLASLRDGRITEHTCRAPYRSGTRSEWPTRGKKHA